MPPKISSKSSKIDPNEEGRSDEGGSDDGGSDDGGFDEGGSDDDGLAFLPRNPWGSACVGVTDPEEPLSI